LKQVMRTFWPYILILILFSGNVFQCSLLRRSPPEVSRDACAMEIMENGVFHSLEAVLRLRAFSIGGVKGWLLWGSTPEGVAFRGISENHGIPGPVLSDIETLFLGCLTDIRYLDSRAEAADMKWRRYKVRLLFRWATP